jgi:hypothetical protein
MGWSKFSLSNVGSGLVGIMRKTSSILSLVASSKLSKITVIIALPKSKKVKLHLEIKDFGFTSLCSRNQVLIKNVEDIRANVRQLVFDFNSVFLDFDGLRFISYWLRIVVYPWSLPWSRWRKQYAKKHV